MFKWLPIDSYLWMKRIPWITVRLTVSVPHLLAIIGIGKKYAFVFCRVQVVGAAARAGRAKHPCLHLSVVSKQTEAPFEQILLWSTSSAKNKTLFFVFCFFQIKLCIIASNFVVFNVRILEVFWLAVTSKFGYFCIILVTTKQMRPFSSAAFITTWKV